VSGMVFTISISDEVEGGWCGWDLRWFPDSQVRKLVSRGSKVKHSPMFSYVILAPCGGKIISCRRTCVIGNGSLIQVSFFSEEQR